MKLPGDLERRYSELGISEGDLREFFIRAHGPGGQNVNKRSTAVQLTHLPTGISVKVSDQRSQRQNRVIARYRLLEQIDQFHAELANIQLQANRAKQQRQTRPTRLKNQILASKHQRSQTKANRKKVVSD